MVIESVKHRVKEILCKVDGLMVGFLCKIISIHRGGRDYNNSTSPSVLILPPASPGSLGDEAMMVATINYLRKEGFGTINIIAYDKINNWNYLSGMNKSVIFKQFFFAYSWIEKISFILKMKKYECFYCLGADVMDGYYFPYATCKRVELVSLAAKSGANAAILGFSFNDKPDIECVRALKNLPQNVRLCARDPISHDRLIRHLDRTIELVADLAFLLPQNVSSPITNEISKWIYDERLNNRIIVGVNANYLPVGISDTMSISHQDIVDAYVKILVELSDQEQQFSFVLIPHDRRKNDGKCSDDDLASMIKNKLPAYLKQHCVKLPFPCSSVEIKSICNHIDLALTGRMHVAIACLGVGVPVLCITYQGKFEGLFQYFEIDERMLLEPQVLLEIEKINFLIREVVCNKEKIRKTINSKLLMIEKLSLKNFENY